MNIPPINRETLGTFIDAVYAIAITILALEIPGEIDTSSGLEKFTALLIDYALSFVILFAIWMQHRRVIIHSRKDSSSIIWVHGLVLLLICLVPRATVLVFHYGGDVTFAEMEASLNHGAGWKLDELVDLFYVSLVALSELLLLLIAYLSLDRTKPPSAQVFRAKALVTSCIVILLAVSFLLPIENRYVLIGLPVILIAEQSLFRLFPGRFSKQTPGKT